MRGRDAHTRRIDKLYEGTALSSTGICLCPPKNAAHAFMLGSAASGFFAVGARHAVPGDRTWRGRAIHRGLRFKGEHW